ncbi:vitamin K epoxide reductase family protein [Candidatus Uhrbacteria bacterium]|nr:vitamin K epoxide reductase family protein [Candidatus Uhrbacteria bacterium]
MKYLKKISIAKMVWVHRAMLWTALVGLFSSAYLCITYLTGAPIVCGIVSGCEVVRASAWATTFGIPRPLLGLAFYGAIILALIIRTYAPHHRPEFWKNVTLLATFFGFVESGFLTLVQTYEIKAYCLWCLLSAACATGLFILSFFESEEILPEKMVTHELKKIFWAFAVFIVVGALAMWILLAKRGGGEQPVISAAGGGRPVLVPEGTPTEGPVSSTVTVVEFLDLECPGCRDYYPIMKKIREDYAGRIRYVVRIFPLIELHAHAKQAAIAAECAKQQGKWFEYVDAALINQNALERDDLVRYADALHLDTKAFSACLDDQKVADAVMAERKAGEAIGINKTPMIFVNDGVLEQLPTYQQFKYLLDEELKK